MHGRPRLLIVNAMRFRSCVVPAALVAAIAGVNVVHGMEPDPAAPRAESPQQASKFLRIVEKPAESVELQVGAQRYVWHSAEPGTSAPGAEGDAGAPAAPHHPTVTLVAVSHVGDAALYQQLQALLDAHDVVLYESVKPPGAGGAGGDTDEERVAGTKSALRFVAQIIEAHHRDRGVYPVRLDDLSRFAQEMDDRIGAFIGPALIDGWQHPFQYQLTDERYELKSLGADGRVGGEGIDADLSAADLGPIVPFKPASEDGLQSELARTLGLKFQLDVIDYDRPNWRCSDMAMDQVDRAMRAQGLDFAPMQGALAGSSLPAQMVKMMLGLIRLTDRMAEGSVVDMIKVMLIELLGDEAVTMQAMNQLGRGMADVIIRQRDQIVMNDLRAIIEHEPGVHSVAVFFGAGHMSDLEPRLLALGYQPSEPTTWMTAIKVDLRQSKLDAAQLRQFRWMLRRSLQQQLGQPPKAAAPE